MSSLKASAAVLLFFGVLGISVYLWIQRQRHMLLGIDLQPAKAIPTEGVDHEEKELGEILHRIAIARESQPRTKRLPDVIGIGVKKCGTGALIHFLSQHPLIKLPPGRIETFFFNSLYSRGMVYYQHLMPVVGRDELVIEKTPSYFYTVPEVPQRIQKHLPNVKLILSLCSPTRRAFSDFVHEFYPRHTDAKELFFAEKFDEQVQRFLGKLANSERKELGNVAKIARAICRTDRMGCMFSKGIYHHYLVDWMERFNKTQLLIINGDEWMTDPGRLVERIQDFLGIPKVLRQKDFVRSPESGFYCLRRPWVDPGSSKNRIKGRVVTLGGKEDLFCLASGKGRTRNGVRSMLNTTYTELRTFYEPHNRKLYDLLEEDFHW